MAAQWVPGMASINMEEKMEAQGVPEEDRAEVRRLAVFLRRRRARKAGEALEPMSKEMRDWLTGKSESQG